VKNKVSEQAEEVVEDTAVPVPALFDPDPAKRRKSRKTKSKAKFYKFLQPVGLAYGFLNGVNKTANPLNWGNTINNITNPVLPSSLDEYVGRLKKNLSFLLGLGGAIYGMLPFKLPYKTAVKNLGN
jgi:hypothetical protein